MGWRQSYNLEKWKGTVIFVWCDCELNTEISLITRFMGPTWGPSGPTGPRGVPMLVPWTLLFGVVHNCAQAKDTTQFAQKFYLVQTRIELWNHAKMTAIVLHANGQTSYRLFHRTLKRRFHHKHLAIAHYCIWWKNGNGDIMPFYTHMYGIRLSVWLMSICKAFILLRERLS